MEDNLNLFVIQVRPRSLWLDSWTWIRVYGDSVGARGRSCGHTTHPEVHRWVNHSSSQWSVSVISGYSLSVSRKPCHHPKESPALSVVSWPVDVWILQLSSKRLFRAGPGEHDAASAYKQIADSGTTDTLSNRNPNLSTRLTVGCVAAPPGVVRRGGDSSLLLLHCPRSCSHWMERSWQTHLALLLHSPACAVQAIEEAWCSDEKRITRCKAALMHLAVKLKYSL